jgi:hypothetical protein
MPGGFHPFHAGHMALYNSARHAFPDADLYVAATNSQEERPFPFSVKEKLAKVAGVEPGHFIQVKSPFQAKEITQNYNPEQDVLIFVRSEKDRNESPKPGGMKKDGTPAYFQPYTGKDMQPFAKHAYFAYLPTVKFGPGITSATEIRKAWPTLNDKRKTAMVMSLYPAAQKNPKLAANVVAMLDQVMGVQENVAEGTFVPRIMHPNKVNIYLNLGIGKEPRLVATDISYEILDKYIQKVIQKYPQFKPTNFSFRASDKVDEGNDDDIWGPQGNFAGDKPVNIGGATVSKLEIGDIVTYFGQKARIEAMSKTGNTSRITIANKMGGITKDVLTRDLKRTSMSEEIGGVGGGFGTNYPGTYEEENGPFTHKGGHRTVSLTTESVDYLDEK